MVIRCVGRGESREEKRHMGDLKIMEHSCSLGLRAKNMVSRAMLTFLSLAR